MIAFGRALHQPKSFRDGTHRSRSPAETLSAYLPLAPSMAITRLADITGLDHIGLPVYVAVRPNSRGLSTSQGKGVDHASAKASALMESIESWHAERIEAPTRHASPRDLARSARVVDVHALPVFKGVAPRDDMPIWWVEGWDLLGAEPIWVPWESVSLNFVTSPTERPIFAMSSNGLASGNHLLEALCHGLLEVIERDADALWMRRTDAEVLASGVDLASVTDPLCRRVLALLDAAGVRTAAFDITSDVGVPAYHVVIHQQRDRWRPLGPAAGMGCHPSAEIALLRALTEAVQSRVTMISGSRDDLFYRDYSSFQSPLTSSAVTSAAERGPALRPLRSSVLSKETFEDDLAVLIEAVKGVGATSVAAVDLTLPGVGVPVVKAIVPGFNLAMNRSYTLPRWRHA